MRVPVDHRRRQKLQRNLEFNEGEGGAKMKILTHVVPLILPYSVHFDQGCCRVGKEYHAEAQEHLQWQEIQKNLSVEGLLNKHIGVGAEVLI
jgi:hypothetical protein